MENVDCLFICMKKKTILIQKITFVFYNLPMLMVFSLYLSVCSNTRLGKCYILFGI